MAQCNAISTPQSEVQATAEQEKATHDEIMRKVAALVDDHKNLRTEHQELEDNHKSASEKVRAGAAQLVEMSGQTSVLQNTASRIDAAATEARTSATE